MDSTLDLKARHILDLRLVTVGIQQQHTEFYGFLVQIGAINADFMAPQHTMIITDLQGAGQSNQRHCCG